jgi:hypothetical protein
VANRRDAGAVDGLLVPVGHAEADRLVEQGGAADVLDHHLRAGPCPCGSPAIFMSWAGGARYALQLALDRVARDLYVEADAEVVKLRRAGGNWHRAATIAWWRCPSATVSWPGSTRVRSVTYTAPSQM